MKHVARVAISVMVASLLCLFLVLVAVSDAQAKANRVLIIDACDIHPVFCGSGGQSDVPDYEAGFAIFNPTRGGPAMLILQVRGSLPDELHAVFLCPGPISDTAGFTGCRLIGTFLTDDQGHGVFRMGFFDESPTEAVVAINVPNFATILANCPDQPNASCAPDPLQ